MDLFQSPVMASMIAVSLVSSTVLDYGLKFSSMFQISL